MKEITYKISRGENGKLVEREEVKGFLAFEMYGYQWGAHEEMIELHDGNFKVWVISEISTGFELESGKIFFERGDALAWAFKYLINKGEAIVRHQVEKAKELLTESV